MLRKGPDDALLAELRSNPLFGLVDSDALSLMVRHAERVRFRAGRKVLREGERAQDVFVLATGGVRIYHKAPTDEEGEIVVKLFRAPAFFGEMEVLLQITWLETVETVLPSEVIRIKGAAFQSLLEQDHALCMGLVRDLTLRLCIATEHARVLAYSSAESRLASLMMDHVNLFGAPDPNSGGIRLDVKISQETLARSLAVSRKTINQTLGNWKTRGILFKREGRYVVTDVERLRGLGIEAKYGLAYKLPG